MRFEWDPAKAEANLRKHGVSFEDARTLFTSGQDYLEIYDERHSDDEDRFIAVGRAAGGVICVVFVERGDGGLAGGEGDDRALYRSSRRSST